MFHLKALFATLAIFKIAASLPLAEKIKPVDLAHTCIKPDSGDEIEDKSPILLIHGLGGSRKNWIGTDLLLAQVTKRRVCAIDLRNHGESPWSNRSDVADNEVDINHFLDTQGIKKVNIIGHSVGGMIAAEYTLDFPDRVDSLIVEDFVPRYIDGGALEAVDMFFRWLGVGLGLTRKDQSEREAKLTIADYVIMKVKSWISQIKLSSDDIAKNLEIELVDGKWRFKFNMEKIGEIINDPKKSFETRPWKMGLRYKGPILFVYGTKSPFRVWTKRELMEWMFPKAKFVPIEGANHFVHKDFPIEFNDAVIRFMNELD